MAKVQLMIKYFLKSVVLLAIAVTVCCVIYPLAVWMVGQMVFPFQANGSLLYIHEKPVGSKLIAQPFTKDAYFHSRPSAAAYNAAASASSSLAPSNDALRDRVAQSLGLIAVYKTGSKAGQSVGPDIDQWFQRDKFLDQAHLVTQWASLHPSAARSWVNADAVRIAHVKDWAREHSEIEDPIVLFFREFSKRHPGAFPSFGNPSQLVNSGQEIQSLFFEMWLEDHPEAEVAKVPADMVMTSASGLDPHMTLENAKYQLPRIVSEWSSHLKRDPKALYTEIEQRLEKNAAAPLGGLAGEKFVNVLEINIELYRCYGEPPL
jgi:K+-transporting ATPase ATPase C chain